MPIAKPEDFKKWEDANTDPYGKCCVDVAREVMRLLDLPEYANEIDTHAIINKADDNIDGGGITGFMAGCVAAMVSQCHSRGEEFRKTWNLANQIQHEGEKANEGTGVLNPALLNLGLKK
ncbi:MAG: hypothetical protein C5B54_10235 [Acidobacteria bacterium]|nr:MAG: hypothetical protein C5B54_10235 [Acidobacteriota bacterium]